MNPIRPIQPTFSGSYFITALENSPTHRQDGQVLDDECMNQIKRIQDELERDAQIIVLYNEDNGKYTAVVRENEATAVLPENEYTIAQGADEQGLRGFIQRVVDAAVAAFPASKGS